MQISIIIATYNAAKTLKRCLDSIVPQLTDECELILVDGVSKDNTNAIIDSYGDNVSTHISEQDQGVYDAWNKGIKVSHGNWIMFVGADDMLLPGIISRYIQLLENPQLKDYDYISGIDEYVNSKGKLIKEIGSAPAWSKMKKEMVAAHVGSLHNKRLFSSFGLFDLHFKICADYELLIRKKDKLKYLFVPYHIAKMAAGGISCSNQAVKEAFLIRRKNHSVNSIMNIYILIRGMCSLIILKGKLK